MGDEKKPLTKRNSGEKADAQKRKSPTLIAHRGLLRHAPENTLPAFAACLELGIGFELDIRTTKDGHLVVFTTTMCNGQPMAVLNQCDK